MYLMPPPTFVPRDVEQGQYAPIRSDEAIIIGFFGQFRREKRLEDLLKVFFGGELYASRQIARAGIDHARGGCGRV